jgi:transcription initiation factor TFIIIB Brf1 subunit/transcription initiation factor TFIIB
MAETSRNAYADRENLLERFVSIVKTRCHSRTGIMSGVQTTALEIFDVFARRAPERCPKARVNTRNVPVYAAVCLHMASKIEKCERTDVELQNLFDVTPKRFSGASSQIHIALAGHPLHAAISKMSRPLAMTPRVLDSLGESISDEVRRNVRRELGNSAYDIAERELVDCGSSGNVIAGALIHLASRKIIPLKDLSTALGYTTTALKNMCSKAEKLLLEKKLACE